MKNLIQQFKMKPINKLFFAAMTSCCTIFLLFLLVVIEGCSNNSSGPPDLKPDLSLTYDIVSKDIGSYKGKRVKWQGQWVSGTTKEKGNGSSVDAVFVDNAFAAKGESDLDQISFILKAGQNFWVTGTVKGTRKVIVNGVQSQNEVPVLVDAWFEQ